MHSVSAPLQLFAEYKLQVKGAISREGKYKISHSIFISRVGADCFYYTGNNWQSEYRITFRDLEIIMVRGARSKEDIRSLQLPALAKLHAGYYSAVVYDFLNFSEIARAFSRPVRRFAA